MKYWPEYAYWYEDGVLKHDVFENLYQYKIKYPKGFPSDKVYAYRPVYQWVSPWISVSTKGIYEDGLPIEDVPKDILALHLLIGV